MVGVEQVINVNDSSIVWFRIPGFPGYEISNNNYVRSFKSRKKFPLGSLVKWDKTGHVIMSDHNNKRVKLDLKEIWSIVDSQPRIMCKTIEVQNTSRNPYCGIDTTAPVEVGKVVATPKIQTPEGTSFVDFSNIPDIDLSNL